VSGAVEMCMSECEAGGLGMASVGGDGTVRTDLICRAGLVVGDRKEEGNDEPNLSVAVCVMKGLVKHSSCFEPGISIGYSP
jgi:hypothetical protein